MSNTIVKLKTTKGDITVELDEEKAPVTTANFIQYVNDGFFAGTIFHRVINGFMVQCGGMIADMSQKETRDPIVNEGNNGLKNDLGTLAMARTNDPNSATGQFFINHKDNDFLNYSGPGNPGYAVFGKVTDGMDVVNAIAEVETGRSGMHDDVPTETITIESAEVIQPEA
jgi:peptidyl-prolyl cis-trans isomerase B (cyclophilin B)